MKRSSLILTTLFALPLFVLGQENTSFRENATPISGSGNAAFGTNAGINNEGKENVFLGLSSGEKNIKGRSNVFVGFQSGINGDEASNNVFNGYQSGANNTGNENTFIGFQSGLGHEKGPGNVFLGSLSGAGHIEGQENVFLGIQSGAKGEGGSSNVFLGSYSGIHNIANANTFLGHQTGFENVKGEGNVYIGYQAGYKKERSNTLYIENSNSSEPLIWGDFAKNIANINGSFGVNNANPTSAFNLGNSVVRNNNYIVFGKRVATEEFNLPYIGHDSLEGSGNDLALGSRSSKGGINFYTGNQVEFNNSSTAIKMRIVANGNVGIGTTSPDEKLAVNGKIHAKEVRVDMSGWPDYVFAKDYNLPSLQEVENQIKSKGHLENIPSAHYVIDNGIQLGEMNAKLLQKIEELTLYTIQQQKDLEAQKQQNKTLEKRLERLESIIKE